MGSWLGGFRSQNAKGHLLGHVKDLGLDIRDPRVRYYQTNRRLEYHTDSIDIVGLLCLKTAKAGGESYLASSMTVIQRGARARPDLVPALFEPFPTDRRGEVPEGMQPSDPGASDGGTGLEATHPSVPAAWTRLVLEKAPLFALSAACSATAILASVRPAPRTFELYPLSVRLANAVVACAATS